MRWGMVWGGQYLVGQEGRRAAVWILGIPGPQRQDVCTGHAMSDTDGGAEGGGSRDGGGSGGVASLAMCQPLFVSQANIFQNTWRSGLVSDYSKCCPPLFVFSAPYLSPSQKCFHSANSYHLYSPSISCHSVSVQSVQPDSRQLKVSLK